MATHSNILAWRIPWTEEPGGLQSMGLQSVRHNQTTSLSLLEGKLEVVKQMTRVNIDILLLLLLSRFSRVRLCATP